MLLASARKGTVFWLLDWNGPLHRRNCLRRRLPQRHPHSQPRQMPVV